MFVPRNKYSIYNPKCLKTVIKMSKYKTRTNPKNRYFLSGLPMACHSWVQLHPVSLIDAIHILLELHSGDIARAVGLKRIRLIYFGKILININKISELKIRNNKWTASTESWMKRGSLHITNTDMMLKSSKWRATPVIWRMLREA